MYDLIYKETMKKITLYILSISFLFISNTFAECNFVINIGDKQTKIVEKFGEPMPMFKGQFMLPIPSTEVCPNDNLSYDIAVEYLFLGEPENSRLAAIRMIVFNDGKNTVSDQLLLMNYAKKVYGNFDTGQNPKAFNNFNVWDDNQRIVVYKRMTNEEGMIEEELYISNKEYDQKLGEFYNKLEEDEFKEDMN